MLDAVTKASVKNMVAFNYRFVPAVRQARNLIESGALGRIYLATEGINAQIIEGDAFHRYDRLEMRAKMKEAAAQGNPHFSHFGPEANLFAELESLAVLEEEAVALVRLLGRGVAEGLHESRVHRQETPVAGALIHAFHGVLEELAKLRFARAQGGT